MTTPVDRSRRGYDLARDRARHGERVRVALIVVDRKCALAVQAGVGSCRCGNRPGRRTFAGAQMDGDHHRDGSLSGDEYFAHRGDVTCDGAVVGVPTGVIQYAAEAEVAGACNAPVGDATLVRARS